MKNDVKKKHLIFLIGLVLMLVVSVLLKSWKGATLSNALWQALADIRPMEVVLYAGLWYSAVTGNTELGNRSSLLTLGLDEKK